MNLFMSDWLISQYKNEALFTQKFRSCGLNSGSFSPFPIQQPCLAVAYWYSRSIIVVLCLSFFITPINTGEKKTCFKGLFLCKWAKFCRSVYFIVICTLIYLLILFLLGSLALLQTSHQPDKLLPPPFSNSQHGALFCTRPSGC